MRYRNCIMSSVAVAIGALAASGRSFPSHILSAVIAMVVVFLFTGAGNTLNDVLDVDIDRRVHQERPIPSGKVSLKASSIFASSLFAAAVLLSIPLGLYPVTVVLVSLAVILLYEFSLKSKGLPGNLSIAWLTASLFLFGAISVGNVLSIWAFFLTSFLATAGREIMKDIEDVEGDRGRRRTLPMIIGNKGAMAAASISIAGAIAISPFPYLLHQFKLPYLITVLVADAIFVRAALIQRKDETVAQTTSKVAMYVAILAFLVGAVSA